MRALVSRRVALALLVLLAATATVTVLDPHRALGGREPDDAVSTDSSPSTVRKHARLNTVGVPVRMRVRTTPGPGNDTPPRNWVHVDRDAGRSRRIVDHRVLNRSGGTERGHRVYRFAYRNVSVARPSWAPWPSVELAYDALSV